MRLDLYSPQNYSAGAPFLKQLFWFFVGDKFVQTHWLPWAPLKVFILKLFGAQIGKNVNIKPGVKVKFPWRLFIGDYAWIGENVWIDNLANVTIESHVCISQGAFLCTGNHNWSKASFDLVLGEIRLQEGSWIGAKAIVCPHVTVGRGAILTVGSVATKSLESMTIYSGNPALLVKKRLIQ